MKLLKELIKESVDEEILAFFEKNPNPPDKKIHALADKLGLHPDELEERVYKLLSKELSKKQ